MDIFLQRKLNLNINFPEGKCFFIHFLTDHKGCFITYTFQVCNHCPPLRVIATVSKGKSNQICRNTSAAPSFPNLLSIKEKIQAGTPGTLKSKKLGFLDQLDASKKPCLRELSTQLETVTCHGHGPQPESSKPRTL